jgi:uncharacterized protein
MIREITSTTLSEIRNPAFRQYAQRYIDIYQKFLAQVAATGIELAPETNSQEYLNQTRALAAAGAIVRNDAKSVVSNPLLSPGCQACQTGVASATFFISLKCHRSCFYCFNPNQENYDHYLDHSVDVVAELKKLHGMGQDVRQLALTGGEPLLNKPETVHFFQTARKLYPKVSTRLYTCGDHIDAEILQQLQDAGLDEIRFSIRVTDLEKGRQFTLERIALAKAYIPRVMVEMPVLPGSLEEMKAILLRLDEIGIFGINLLELCFPFHNAEEFRQRGYQVKAQPFRVLYNYWYAGGLPIAGSEKVCLDLVDFALKSGLKLGVHYCSLENKHTGQVYRQNKTKAAAQPYTFSERDYFLKSAKVFGDEMALVKEVFRRKGYSQYEVYPDRNYLEFSVKRMHLLKNTEVEIGISTNIFEERGGEKVLRELRIDWTTPQLFAFEEDI